MDTVRHDFPILYKLLGGIYAQSLDNESQYRRKIVGKISNPLMYDPKREYLFRRNRALTLLQFNQHFSASGEMPTELDYDALENTMMARNVDQDTNILRRARAFATSPYNSEDLNDYLHLVERGTAVAGILIGGPVGLALGVYSFTIPYWPRAYEQLDKFSFEIVSILDSVASQNAITLHEKNSYEEGSPSQVLLNSLGIPAGQSTDFILEALPSRYRIGTKEAIDHIGNPSNNLEIAQSILDQPFKDLQRGILIELKNERIARNAVRAQKIRARGEIEGGIQLGGSILRHVFGDDYAARIFETSASQVYKVWNLLDGFSSTPPTVGPLALASGYVSAAFIVVSLLQKRQGASQEEALQKALAAIFEAIRTLRSEMHTRFDRIESTQKEILDKLSEILGLIKSGMSETFRRLVDLHDSVTSLRNYIESQDRAQRINAFNLNFRNFQLELDRYESPSEAASASKIEDGLTYFLHHAIDVAKEPAFTHCELDNWNSKSILNTVQASPRPDLLISIPPIVLQQIGETGFELAISNPLEWCRGAQAVIGSMGLIGEMPRVIRDRNFLQELNREGNRIRKLLLTYVRLDTRKAIIKRYIDSATVIGKLLDEHYQEVLEHIGARTIYVSDYPYLRRWFGPSNWVPGLQKSTDTTIGEYWDPKILYQKLSGSMRGLPLDTFVNPIDAAEDAGVLDVVSTKVREVPGSSAVEHASPAHTVETVYLSMKLGHLSGWRSSTFTRIRYKDIEGNCYILESSFRLLNGTQTKMSITHILSDIRDQTILRNRESRNMFLSGLENYLNRNYSYLDNFRAWGACVRLLAGILEYGRSATLDQASKVVDESWRTLDSPGELGEFLRTAITMKSPIDENSMASPRTSLGPINLFGKAIFIKDYTDYLNKFLEVEGLQTQMVFPEIDICLAQLRGLAFHCDVSMDISSISSD